MYRANFGENSVATYTAKAIATTAKEVRTIMESHNPMRTVKLALSGK
jgi:hypothetical protein